MNNSLKRHSLSLKIGVAFFLSVMTDGMISAQQAKTKPTDTLNTSNIQEVVVTALGIKRQEKALGYATQNISGKSLQAVQGLDITESLTGKVAGLVIKNTTEFDGSSGIELRGSSPLLVIDGVPYGNLSLKDVPADNIQDITVLKGATASALYGSRGSVGAIMITTKQGGKKGTQIEVNSNTMFRAGWTAIPKAQTSYGHGINGKISDDYVWGPKLDIGNTAVQWNPVSKEFEDMPLVSSGKNNFKNFLQSSFVSNNNISITQTGENGFLRVNLNDVYNKGQFPNQKLNRINYSMSGQLRLSDKFSIDSQLGYVHSEAPQTWGGGYNDQGYIYQLLMWTGPDYDLRQYKDYWVQPNVQQNWLYKAWYDNPYLIAYEKLDGRITNKLHGELTMNYKIWDNLKLMFRNGYDFYKNEEQVRNPEGINSTRGPSVSGNYWGFNGKGMFGQNQTWGLSINSDLIATYNKSVGAFDFDALAGSSIYYYKDRYQGAVTANGLAVPGWYSLANAVPSQTPGVNSINNIYGTTASQVNSLYGKFSVGWDKAVYVDLTGRNDWSSTQPKTQQSYFYPSVATSVILSQFLHKPQWLDLWKVRGSWTISKSPLGVYANNRPYNTSNQWGMTGASISSSLRGTDLLPSESRSWEFGTAGYFLHQRLHLDVTYFTKLYFHRQINQTIAGSSGFSSTLINTRETYANRGVEITLSGSPIKTKDFEWQSMVNVATDHSYYVDLDPIYSATNQWVKPENRTDYIALTEKILKDANGNIIHKSNGLPWLDDQRQLYGYSDPKFMFGFVNNFTYKNWTMTVGIDGRIGGLMDDYVYGKMFDTGSAPATDTPARYDEVVNGKLYVGQGVKVISGAITYDPNGIVISDTRQYAPNDIPVSYQQYMRSYGNSWDQRMRSATFIKLRQVSITYNIPKDFVNKFSLSNASISFTGQNLFLWTKDFKFSDPDVGSDDMNAPSQRVIGFNIKVGF